MANKTWFTENNALFLPPRSMGLVKGELQEEKKNFSGRKEVIVISQKKVLPPFFFFMLSLSLFKTESRVLSGGAARCNFVLFGREEKRRKDQNRKKTTTTTKRKKKRSKHYWRNGEPNCGMLGLSIIFIFGPVIGVLR